MPQTKGETPARRFAMKSASRPIHLDLLRIRLPLPGRVSILHRVSGVLLFLALPLGVALLSVSLTDEAGFRVLSDCVRQPLAKLLAIALAWSFSHHFFAGLRHLALDAHLGTGLARARQSSLAVFAASAVATLAFAAWVLQ